MFPKIAHIASRYIDFLFGFVSVAIYLSLCGLLIAAHKTALATMFLGLLAAAAVASAVILIIFAFKPRKDA